MIYRAKFDKEGNIECLSNVACVQAGVEALRLCSYLELCQEVDVEVAEDDSGNPPSVKVKKKEGHS